ncbi:MAG TPA: LysR family transcriptional regulator [Candidatus Thiothrix moscowensis]|uniref:LysR family transcriptional regulator n=1 Tax=unclassified Thiothrix TaxID=2636184 RepID=UPI0025F6C0DD|nr:MULTISPECIES: LysR family transcriptional regulator [unclassified Thiothrix]HRJ51627.1 LysR family transcriptional regulator [Candidatus Thiothrix moscowensis]HRJ91942.1 LysR family transcriptional regulator [Candidatus Thiothrix moscowensis]
MKIKNLGDLEVFMLTAESGSLSAAARLLNISPALTSAALKRLETDLGLMLFVRSTRSLRLTPEGQRLLPAAKLALQELHDALEELSTGKQVIRGHLQISIPSDLGRNQVLNWLDAFQNEYPEVTIRLHLSDSITDLYRQPVDVAIRYGDLPDSNLIALPLLPQNRRVLCASPIYLAKHGKPNTPDELSRHNCLRFNLDDNVHEQWQFYRDGQTLTVMVNGNRRANDGDAVHRWALAGHGIAYKSMLDVLPSLRTGELVRLCPDWEGEPTPLWLVCADRRQLSPTVVLLREHLQKCCKTTVN